jgi:hypothetical protein
VVAAATAASTTAAVPFITKILNLLKKINFKKLISKVNISKLAKNKKKAEQSDDTTQDGESAIPDSEGTDTPNDDTSESTTDNSDAVSEGATNTEENGENGENLPATNAMRAFATPVEENILTKAITWVKENQTTSILIGAGAAFLIYQAIKPSPKKTKEALSGTRKGKRKKRKAKNHPPHTVSGTRNRRVKKIKL